MHTEDSIRAEIRDYHHPTVKANGSAEHICLYFNNFRLDLPGGIRRDFLAELAADPRRVRGGKRLQVYYEELDESLRLAGVQFEEIKQMLPDARNDYNARQRLFEKVLPAFINLRNIGYTHGDLCT